MKFINALVVKLVDTKDLKSLPLGECQFESGKLKSRFHKSYQPHSLTTLNEKCLCIVLWRDKLNSEVKVVNDI